VAVLGAWCVGLFARGYWTPDEPREADIGWRMSWQPDKAVPLLAGEAFCEKPPLTYWVAGASIRVLGASAWAARLPNLLYALLAALGVGFLARRGAGRIAALAAGAALATFLLSYQVLIWLATDAPLLAGASVALLGAYIGFYATSSVERLRGYTLMHAMLALGFLSKSAVAWMVPALALPVLAIWERRWRELLRWELYAGLLLQAAVIGAWVWTVYSGPDGLARLRIFFWNNLAGRFAHVDAPGALAYDTGHRNTPGKYLIELPMYLWPWTLLVAAALRRAWLARRRPPEELRAVRFALAASLPSLALLSFAATARNIYLAPALPGFALLLGWWVSEALGSQDRWDTAALRVTALLLLIAAGVFGGCIALAIEWWQPPELALAISIVGLIAAILGALIAEHSARRGRLARGLLALILAYCALLTLPASQLYRAVDVWQDLASVARAVRSDSAGHALILMAPDETTRAIVDLYARTNAEVVEGPVDSAALARLRQRLAGGASALVLTQLPGRESVGALKRAQEWLGVDELERERVPGWILPARLRILHRYSVPNGRRYALLEAAD
jgi:4-amino-4-deoxy-L-arabinose transferase-like glycosyltransferase